MARLNRTVYMEPVHTHGGGRASLHVSPIQTLSRLVLACMLWEDQFYIDGKTTAELIASTIPSCNPQDVAQIAIAAREDQKLRHVPLLVVRELVRHPRVKDYPGLVRGTLARIIQRPDELAEFLAIYWKEKKQPLAASVKKGLADAFQKFSPYQLAKYNRDNAIKLRDVLFLSHAKPKSTEQEETFKKLVDKTLESADTWETRLSGGEGKKSEEDKKAHWTALLNERKLGALALIRNLRNMQEAGVDEKLIREALTTVNVERVLPFRFITAAKHNTRLEDAIEQAMFKCVEKAEKLPGKTILIVDVSGSMYGGAISAKSELTRVDAAGALAILIRECCEQPVIYATAGSDWEQKHDTKIVPNRRGFALSELITNSDKLCRELGGGGIFLTQVMDYVAKQEAEKADRIIVITDEQDCEHSPAKSAERANAFGTHNYIINVASYENGIGYGKWTKINGWSEAVIDYIRESEKQLMETSGQGQAAQAAEAH